MASSVFSPRALTMFEVGFLADALQARLQRYQRIGNLDEESRAVFEAGIDFIKELEDGGLMSFSVGRRLATGGAAPSYTQKASRAYGYARRAWKRANIGVPENEDEFRDKCRKYREILQGVLDGGEPYSNGGLNDVEEVKRFFREISRRTLVESQSRGLR